MLLDQEPGVAPAGRETTPALSASMIITAISNERQGQHPQAYSYTCIRDIGTRVKAAWPMTADEERSFAYFQQHSIVSLTALFESPLWQRHVLQMCHADPAIFHAVTMLSAAHQRSELKHMQRVQGTPVHRVYCFSLQQSSRAMRLLSQRLASQDPELRHVVLLCSLLFGLSDVLLDRHESAWTHFLSGLRILKEIEHHPDLISKAEPSLVAVYRRISLQAALYSNKNSRADAPPPPVPTYVPPPPPDDALKASTCPFSSLAQMQSVLLRLLDTGIPLIATGLSLSDYDFSYIADYRDRPTRVADHGVSANMYLLATRAPDLSTGLRAVAVLRVWPRYVGFHSSTSAAPLALNMLVERFGGVKVDM
ncbi:uncharacterized protein BDW70DRAFT_170386 [Aspergillus foveolatus]|uniref:uncharacterized protein n=1 Tax=Aspergillus foveolatus TaxID=210207 RepID=UPI003CCE41A8